MSQSIEDRVHACLTRFVQGCGVAVPVLKPNTDLHGGLGLTSDQGVEFVLDLCEEFSFDFPKEFNPVVHDSGKRGRKVQELVAEVERMLSTENK